MGEGIAEQVRVGFQGQLPRPVAQHLIDAARGHGPRLPQRQASKGCVAVRVTEHLPGWRRMAPEVRLGDIWALRPGGRPKNGTLVAVVPKQPSDEGESKPTGGIYRARTKILEACNPGFPSLSMEDFDVVAVGEALLWRDYREGVQR